MISRFPISFPLSTRGLHHLPPRPLRAPHSLQTDLQLLVRSLVLESRVLKDRRSWDANLGLSLLLGPKCWAAEGLMTVAVEKRTKITIDRFCTA